MRGCLSAVFVMSAAVHLSPYSGVAGYHSDNLYIENASSRCVIKTIRHTLFLGTPCSSFPKKKCHRRRPSPTEVRSFSGTYQAYSISLPHLCLSVFVPAGNGAVTTQSQCTSPGSYFQNSAQIRGRKNSIGDYPVPIQNIREP